MKKQEKIVKILLDGNIAKVGMIVVILTGAHGGNNAQTITKITKIKERSLNKNEILCECIGLRSGFDICKIQSWYEYTNDIRKATPEERKQYYKDLYARNNK